jgi:pentatricopeptide repeat protein
MNRQDPANRLAIRLRKATFAFVMACFFGATTSLSSSSPQKRTNAAVNVNSVPPEGLFETLCISHSSTWAEFNHTIINRSRRVLSGYSYENDTLSLLDCFRKVRKAVLEELRQDNNFDGAKVMICGMIEYLVDHSSSVSYQSENAEHPLASSERLQISETIDGALQVFFHKAFASPFRGRRDYHRVKLGIDLLNLQLRSMNVLSEPFNTVPKSVIVQALTAVTTLQERQCSSRSTYFRNFEQYTNDVDSISPQVAFRLLQRLVTGVGIRFSSDGRNTKNKERKTYVLYEVDFNRVLNTYSSLGKMNMAHRVVALQERTPHAPSLSPVTYSILVKGYGKLGDWNNIDMLVQHAAENYIVPDTILFNSIIDAYINCNQLDKAYSVFHAMVGNSTRSNVDFPFASKACPSPNLRTYNTLLKGYAQMRQWDAAKRLSNQMKADLNLWDHVTTNTLVQAAVEAREFQTAENVLKEHTVTACNEKGDRHPNSDAYTSLMDGYCKGGKLDKAVALIKTMTDRSVEPNEFHFSSIIGGLARHKRTDQARKLILHLKGLQLPSKSWQPIFNAFISGLINRERLSAHDDYDKYVDEAVRVLREMMDLKIFPDVITVAVLLDGFGHCKRPRVVEATTLVNQLERRQIIAQNNTVVATALIGVFTAAGDLEKATEIFHAIHLPDIAAINAYLDASVRCGNIVAAADTFDRFFRDQSSRFSPDVISYSTMIKAYLKRGTLDGSRAAREMYHEMKFQRRILPDKALIDM